MVSTNDTEVLAPSWQLPIVLQCPESHLHAPYHFSPCNWQCTGSPLKKDVPPVTISQPPAHQKRAVSPSPVLHLHEALDGLRQHRVAWDITESHLKARCVTSRGLSEPIPDYILNRPATRPAVRDMRIACDSFPWEVLIHIPKLEGDKVITVGLVLEAIHGVMREELELEDWERMSSTMKKKVHAEMCTRLSMAEPSIEATVRVLKIDSLLGRTEFQGMEYVDRGEDTWLLSLGPPVNRMGSHRFISTRRQLT